MNKSKQIIKDIKRVAKQIGGTRIAQDRYFQSGGKFTKGDIKKYLGNWTKALAAAKIGVVPARGHNITIERLFFNIDRVWALVGSQPSIWDMNSKGFSLYSSYPYVSRFGSWKNTLVEYRKWKASLEDKSLINFHESKRRISPTLRYKVLNHDNSKCRVCGNSPTLDPTCVLQVDHIVPYSKGGKTTFENLQTLCRQCNLGKGTN